MVLIYKVQLSLSTPIKDFVCAMGVDHNGMSMIMCVDPHSRLEPGQLVASD